MGGGGSPIDSARKNATPRVWQNGTGMKALTVLLSLALVSCSRKPDSSFAQMADEFVYTSLAFSPVAATAVGYHKHQGVNLDEQLDDVSAAAMERQRQFYSGFRDRLSKIVKPDQLSSEDRADYDIIQDQISLALLDLDQIRSLQHNPTIYVESIGNALFNPYVLEYAPKPQRMRDIIARTAKIPAFLEQAKKNLTDAPGIWTKVAAEENDGNIGLVDKTLRAGMPDDLRSRYEQVANTALAALRGFNDYLKNELSRRSQFDWRLGAGKYRQKFQYALATDLSPEQVLAAAEADIKAVQARMAEVASKLYPGQGTGMALVAKALARISQRHATPETYIAEATRDLEEARQFVAAKRLLTLPSRGNLQVIETPEFMRGIYAVGGFNAAPALEPQLGAFYWVTPIPKDWPAKRVESKLREYNFYKLKLLTIHEAMPGHYVQFEYANDIEPKTRRVIRSVFGNNPYIEGWAQYATQMMLDNGYLDNSLELRLTFQKEELRVLANAIIDIRLQTMGMTERQAVDLMEKETFQETEEATAKLQRAQLSSCQLPTYLVGWRDWIRVREQYRESKGGSYRLAEFNDRALKEGAVPLPALARLLTGKTLSAASSR